MDAIAELLRRQRQDIDDLLEETLSRSSQTAELVSSIEALRRRSEDTLRRFRLASGGSEPEK